MATQRPSSTSVTSDAPIAIYSNSKEATDLSPNYIRVIPGNSVGASFIASDSTTFDDVNLDTSDAVDTADAAASTDGSSKQVITKVAPDLSDIQVVSNTIVYDASGNPSATIVFKVKNSSGTTLKGMNARVKVV